MHVRTFRFAAALVVAAGFCAATARGDAVVYRQPPKAIEDGLRAPVLPDVLVSPTRDSLAIVTLLRYPPIADLARPMLRLAGLRIDPQTNGIHHAFADTSIAIERVSDGTVMPVALPPNARETYFRFSPDGKHFAFTNATSSGTDLYIGSTARATIARVPGVKLNGIFGNPITCLPDNAHLIVLATARIQPAPADPTVPAGPVVQDASRGAGAIVTYEDLLADPHDEDLFDYYGTSRLTEVDLTKNTAAPFGARAMYTSVSPSPDGRYLLVERLHRPYSYLFPYNRFPTETAVLDRRGRPVTTIVSRPLADNLPVDGVATGPRNVAWQPNAPASLVWWDALDGGDPRKAVPQRDKLMLLQTPAASEATELARTTGRGTDVEWLAGDDRAFVAEYDRDNRLTTTSILDARAPGTLKLRYAAARWGPLQRSGHSRRTDLRKRRVGYRA